MSVQVDLPAGLARYSNNQTTVSIAARSLNELFGQLWRHYPDLRVRIVDDGGNVHPYLAVIHNHRRIPNQDSRVLLEDGDLIEIMTLASGG